MSRLHLSPLSVLAFTAQVVASLTSCGGRTESFDVQSGLPADDSGAAYHDGSIDSDGGQGPFTPEQVASGITGPCNVLAHQGRLYWTTTIMPDWTTVTQIWGCDLDDCSGTSQRYVELVSDRALLAADEERIYWGSPWSTSSTIGSCLHGGCTAQPSPTNCAAEVDALAADGTSLFWTTGVAGQYGTLFAASKTTDGCDGVAMDESPGGTGAGAVVVDDQSVFWIREGASGSVMMMPKSGGNAVTLASAQNLPSAIFVDAEAVYWTTRWAAGAILRCAKTGCGETPTPVLTGLQRPDALLGDDVGLFWTVSPSGSSGQATQEVHGCQRANCPATARRLASTPALPDCRQRLAQDESYIYWADDPTPAGSHPSAQGRIMRIHK